MPESRWIELFEVGPRDGLQNEKATISTAGKVELVDALSACGLRRIEVGSFVSPKWVPQMADTEEVLAGIRRFGEVRYAALVPNLKGLERAARSGVDEVAVFVSATEGFSRANTNAGVEEMIDRIKEVVAEARRIGLATRGYVSCVIRCPYDGPVDPARVAFVADSLWSSGCFEISLGDTIGAGDPDSVERMILSVGERVPLGILAGHYHDTGGRALDNILKSAEIGVGVFDTAIGGMGGCPFAPGSAGNVATERVNEMLLANGYRTGLDKAMLARARRLAHDLIGREA